ncbi:ABC transporter ATP-binding protein [Croceimicrobium hydrocarbonivorans]|uniref:ABC transporter ATP-binding protein n=1 Tax=Croceimicrobium hydrocarbonivorans TaxID=2761580 RepID=A0A7H0VHY3_9FLAO|nr:ATP-binding cassette domain-containing protein [Croceimicrobium hydrocarbonivorans]QNR25331.1 ABC transporter ATP-binding protein [Croceimicrobium hydrocarbonivorans]
MKLEYRKAGRRFPGQIVFQNLDLEIEAGSHWAILGANGSGKSTFLKTAFGALSLSEGSLQHSIDGQTVDMQSAALNIAYAAPYFELIEELTVLEFLKTAQGFRTFKNQLGPQDIVQKAMLEEAAKRKIRFLSSGMKQRLKLCLALFSEAKLIILDEPTSNLDRAGVQWFRDLLENEIEDRSLLIGTNYNEDEGFLCDQHLRVTDYQ